MNLSTSIEYEHVSNAYLSLALLLCPLISVLYNREHRLLTRTSWTTKMACKDPRERQSSLDYLQPPSAALVDTSFPSRNEMETKLNGFASTQGYAIVVAKSKKTGRGLSTGLL